MIQVVVAGATGLVGREIVRQLDGRADVACTALVRGSGRLRVESGRVREVTFDYEDPAAYARLGADIPCEVLLCALGTTLAAAGSPEAFRRVDHDYPVRLLEALARLEPRPRVGLVSSMGAGRPRGLYLRTKADVERALLDSGLSWRIVRPGLLLGDRSEFRLGERMAALFLAKPYLGALRLLAPQSRLLWRAAPIEAPKVAEALIRTCLDEPPTAHGRLLSGLALHHPILLDGTD